MNDLIRRYAWVNASMAAMFGLAMPVVYLALLEKGVSIAQFGLLVAAFTLSSVAFDIPFGALADVIGRKRVFMLGEMTMFAATAGIWLVSSLTGLCVVMALSGLSRAMLSGTLDALMVDQMREESGGDLDSAEILAAQAKVGGLSALSLGGAAILGGFLPIWMDDLLHHPRWVGYYEINFAVMLPLIGIHLLLTASVIRDPGYARERLSGSTPERHGGWRKVEKAALAALRSPGMLPLFAIQLVSGAALEMVDAFWQPRLATFIDAKSGSWLFGVLCSISFITMGLGHKVSMHLGAMFRQRYARLLSVLQLSLGLAIILFAFQNEIYGFFVGYVLLYLIAGSMAAPMTTVVQQGAEDDMRSTLLSMKSVVQQCGALAGVLAGAHVAQNYGISVAWLSIGGVVIVSCLWFPVYTAMQAGRAAPINEAT